MFGSLERQTYSRSRYNSPNFTRASSWSRRLSACSSSRGGLPLDWIGIGCGFYNYNLDLLTIVCKFEPHQMRSKKYFLRSALPLLKRKPDVLGIGRWTTWMKFKTDTRRGAWECGPSRAGAFFLLPHNTQ